MSYRPALLNFSPPPVVAAAATDAAVAGFIGAGGSATHAALVGIVPFLAANNVQTGNNRFSGQVAFGANTVTPKMPFGANYGIDAAAVGAGDLIAYSLSATVTGDFTASGTGADPLWGWGLDVFTVTGAGASDGNGGNIQNLIEAFSRASGGTIASVRGLQVAAGFYGAASAATVNDMASLRVSGPFMAIGAVGGSAVHVASLYVESPAIAGTTDTYAINSPGLGLCRFAGGIVTSDANVDAGNGTILAKSAVFAPTGTATNGRLLVASNGAANNVFTVQNFTAQTSDPIRLVDNDGVTRLFSVTPQGRLKWAGTTQQATVGAAGAASAPPATPARWLQIVDSTGTTLVVPAYAAV